jgi:hypothetical protein
MPALDFTNPVPTLLLFIKIGTVVIGVVAIIYSLIFLSGHVVTPGTIRTRLRTGIFAAFLITALAALDIYLVWTSN